MPAFQENGRFVGEQRYRQALQFNNPPLTTKEFEDSLRRAIAIEKLRTSLTGWMSVTDQEVAAEYRRRNEKVKLEVVPITGEAFKSQVKTTDADVAAHFEKNKETYRIGEKRKIKYALVDVATVRKTVIVPEADIEAFYKQNLSQYQTQAQVRASHILFGLEGKDEAAVKAKAEEVLKLAQAPGADFGALARQYSEDSTEQHHRRRSRLLRRGSMVPEFDAAAFSAEDRRDQRPGQDVVRLPHHQGGGQPARHHAAAGRGPGGDRRSAFVAEGAVRRRGAGQDARRLGEDARRAGAASRPSAASRCSRLGLFLRDEPIGALGPQPEMAGAIFGLKEGQVSVPLRVARGWVIGTVSGGRMPTCRRWTK